MTKRIIGKRRWHLPSSVGLFALISFALGCMLLLTPPLASTMLSATTAAAFPTPTPPRCFSGSCSDGIFCNGYERCDPSSPRADARGCVSEPPSCDETELCREDWDRCVPSDCGIEGADQDGDGFVRIGCGGNDCNDQDRYSWAGNVEVCDAEGHDEDCDPTTYGRRDHDGDSEDDIRCFNRDEDGTVYHGTDYDDNNPAVRRGSMICDGPDAVVVSGAESLPCPIGTKCVVQPNRTGICMVPPTDYVAPGRFEVPRTPAPLPTLRTLLSQRGLTQIRSGPTVPMLPGRPADSREKPSVAKPVRPTARTTDSASGSAREIAACKSTLQSGKVSWGGGTKWSSVNIDKLCDGTKNAKDTISCFESNVKALGWSGAIDRCK